MTYFKKHLSLTYMVFSFLLPLLIIICILASKGIWLGSETTILASDAFHQYVVFNQVLRNTLHSNGSLFYTFTSGLGLNFYALSSYYLGSFLSPLTFFFDIKSMADAIYLFTIVKFGLTGLSTYISLKGIYQKLHPTFALLLATSFSLMSFSTSQLEINIWLDVFILIPILLLGIHKLLTGRGRVLYFVSLLCLLIQNYYFGYMTALFLSLWVLVQLTWDIKSRRRYFIDFIVVSLQAGLASMIMLLPTYLDLKTHGETFTEIVNLQTEKSWYLDIFAKTLVGSYDTTKFGAIPMIYVGLFPLLFALLFFTLKSIKWQIKCAYAFLLAFVIASFYLQPLDLLWQGMHAPNMFLHRYAWVFSLIIIYLAAETLSRFADIELSKLSFPFLFLTFGLLLTYFFINHYEFLEGVHFLLSFEFLFAYLILLLAILKKKITLQTFTTISLFFVLFEISLNTNYQVDGLSSEWHFPSRSNYEQNLTQIDSLVNYSKEQDFDFYRTERLFPQTGNDSMKYDYNGISQFSSIRNRASSSTLDKLGFRSDGTNLNLRYQNNTLIADSLFAIRYNLAEGSLSKFGFQALKTEQPLTLYQNQYAAPLAIMTQEVYKDVTFTHLTLDNQTKFLNQLTGLNLQYYESLTPTSSQNGSELGNRITVNQAEGASAASIQYTLHIPAQTQLYVTLPDIQFASDTSKNVQFIINNQSKNFTLDNTFSFFDAGYFAEEEEIQLTILFPDNQQVSFNIPEFYRLNTEAYQTAIDTILKKKVEVTTSGNTVRADYQADTATSLLFTLPYDKGWSAKQNGKNLTITRAQNGFMKVDVEKGKGTIILTFIPQGFVAGSLCFIGGIALFICYNWVRNRRKDKHVAPYKDR